MSKKVIAASELILRKDGSIYHLALRPDQIADLVITVGDPERVKKVSKFFDKIEFRTRSREFVTHTGWIGKTRLSVVSTGIGTDNIDIVLNELDALVNIDFTTRTIKSDLKSLKIVRLGTSGSIQKSVAVDSILVSSAAFGFDGLMPFYAQKDAPFFLINPIISAFEKHAEKTGAWPTLPYFFRASKTLVEKLGKDWPTGITATNAGFYGPQGRELRLRPARPDFVETLAAFDFEGQKITNLEMETAGTYGLAELLGHEAVSVNAILAGRGAGEFSKNPEKTVEKMIRQTLEKLV